MRVALIDCEGGHAPVNSLIRKGTVDLYDCKTFEQADLATTEIFKREGTPEAYDTVVLDQLSSLSTTWMQDSTPAKPGKIWATRGARKITQPMWGEMSNDAIRLTRQLYQIKGMVVVVCLEGERKHPNTGEMMYGPDLNNMLLKDLYGFSDAIVRVARLPNRAEIDGARYERGTRVLRLQDSDKYMAKGRDEFDGPQRPELLVNPTMSKFLAVCNPPPHRLIVYGAPGAGKTVFSCSQGMED